MNCLRTFPVRSLRSIKPSLSAASICTPTLHLGAFQRRNLSSNGTPELINKVARTAIKNALASNPGSDANAEQVETALSEAIKSEAETIKWIQDLLNSSEGGGYIVPEAGLLSHNIFWGDMVCGN